MPDTPFKDTPVFNDTLDTHSSSDNSQSGDASPEISLHDIQDASRREFLKTLATTGVALTCTATLSAVLAACGGGSPTNSTTPPPATGEQERFAASSVPALATVGGGALRTFPNRNNGNPVLIVRVAAGNGSDVFRSMTALCTHAGCTVDTPGTTAWTCLCHGSRFSIQASNFGAVVNGPAARPLQTFPTTFDGTNIIITF